jgi:hypothetical protein
MSGFMVAAMDSARRSPYAFTQYREADDDEARAALELFAAYLESLKPMSPEWQPGEAPLTDEKGLAFDKMLTYGRLAVRSEQASRAAEAMRYWQQAERHAQALNGEQPTRDRIRVTLTRIDSGQPGMSSSSPR